MAPRPHFFIVRPDTKRTTADGRVNVIPGSIVPLIAVDELPEWLDIADVARELSVEQTVGLCNLGTADRSKGSYAVKIIHKVTPAARQQSAAVKAAEVKPSAAPSSHPNTITPATSPPTATHPADRMRAHWIGSPTRNQNQEGIINSIHHPHQQQQQHQQQASQSQRLVQQQPPSVQQRPGPPTTSTLPAAGPATATTTTNPTHPNLGATRPSTTGYCRHWCHHGTCKWGLQCRYLHAMPTTPAELAEVGLRGVPAWWIAAAAAGVGGDGGGLGPRDVRLDVIRRLGLLAPPQAQPIPHVGAGGAGVGHAGGLSKRATRARLRETAALLRELGVGLNLGVGYGPYGKARKRDGGISPLQRATARKGGVETEALLSAAGIKVAAVAAAAVGTSAGAGVGQGQGQGQGQAGAAVTVVDGNKEGGGQTARPGGQIIAAEQVGKLVDV